jgi:ABC-type transport system substrate-binding protein
MIYGDARWRSGQALWDQSWWPDYNDAWNGVYPLVSCDSWGSKGANSKYYCNEEVQALLEEAKDASTIESYEEILGRMLTIISRDDPPAIYYAQPNGQPSCRRTSKGSSSIPSTSARTTSGSSPVRRNAGVFQRT